MPLCPSYKRSKIAWDHGSTPTTMSGQFRAGDWNTVSIRIVAVLLLCLSAAAVAQLNQSPVLAPFEVESSPPDPSQGTIRLDVVGDG